MNLLPPNTDPTPKTRFLALPDAVKHHRAMMEDRAFERGIDFALLQYQVELAGKCTDANAAMRTGLCLLGAQEFVHILKTLSETSKLSQVARNDNLVQNT